MFRRSSDLFVRLVHTKKVNLSNLSISSKLINTTGWSKIKVRIKDDTKANKHMNLEQEEHHYTQCSSIVFMITSNVVYGNFILFPIYNREETTSNLLIGNEYDMEMTVINTKHFIGCITDVAQPPQCLQVIFVDHAVQSLIKLNQYFNLFYPFLTDRPYVISSYKLKWDCFQNTFWLHPVPVGVYFTYVSMLKILKGNLSYNADALMKICNTSSVGSDIIDQNPTFIVRNDNCLQSTVSIYILPDHNYLFYCTVSLQEYFVEIFINNHTVILLKRCSDDNHYLHNHYPNIHNISMVSYNVT